MIYLSDPLRAELVYQGVHNNPIVSIDNRLRLSGITIVAGGATAARLQDGDTWSYWVPDGAAPIVEFSFTPFQTCTLAAIASHNLGTLRKRIQPQAFVGGVWTALGVAVDPTDNQPIMWAFEPVTAQRWRFVVTDPNASGTGIAIAVAHVGRYYQFESRFYEGYDEVRTPNRVDLLVNESRSHKLGVSIVARGRSLEWSLDHLTEESLYGADFGLFRDDFNAGRSFFAAWRPGDYGTCYYAWRAGDPVSIINAGPRRLKALSLAMTAFGDE